jgi:hypothetical protein
MTPNRLKAWLESHGHISERLVETMGLELRSQARIVLTVALSLTAVALLLGLVAFAYGGNHQPDPGEQKLTIDRMRYNDRGELDVLVNNVGGVAAVVDRLEVTVVKDHQLSLSPSLEGLPLSIPIADAKEGDTRGVDVAIEVPVGKAERLLIALQTTRVLTIRLTVHYGHDLQVSETMKISLDS